MALTIAEKGESNPNLKEMLVREFNSAVESNINAYEEACAKYLDNKVDKERFKRNYRVEIRQLVQDPNNKDRFNSTTSLYECILKVYKEWNNLEG